MLVADICTKDVVTASRGDALLDAARKMRERHVGAVVVVEEHEAKRLLRGRHGVNLVPRGPSHPPGHTKVTPRTTPVGETRPGSAAVS